MNLLAFMMELDVLHLFGFEKYTLICNRVRHLISLKNSITYVFSHYYENIKIDSYGFLPTQKYWLCML